MYNLRYHIITIVAIFLALALGLLMGAAIGGSEALRLTSSNLVEGLRKDFNKVVEERDSLQAELERSDKLSVELLSAWGRNRLANRSILIVTDPKSTAAFEQVDELIKTAGGKSESLMFTHESFTRLSDEEMRDLLSFLESMGLKSSEAHISTSISERMMAEISSGALRRLKSDEGEGKLTSQELLEQAKHSSYTPDATRSQVFIGTCDPSYPVLLSYLREKKLINLSTQGSTEELASVTGIVDLALTDKADPHPLALNLVSAALEFKVPALVTQLASYDDKLLIDAQVKGFSGIAACETFGGQYGILALLSGAEPGVYGLEGSKAYPDLP